MKRRLSLAFGLFIAIVALVYQVGCGSGGSSPAAPMTPPPSGGGGASVTISIVGDNGSQSFSPNPASVPVGQTVAWRNVDSTTHHIVADDGSFDAGLTAPGATGATVTVGNGTITYHCSIHPSMVGTIKGSQGNNPGGRGYCEVSAGHPALTTPRQCKAATLVATRSAPTNVASRS
jgi:plastocyanin